MPAVTASHMNSSSCPSYSTSNNTPCYIAWKSSEGWLKSFRLYTLLHGRPWEGSWLSINLDLPLWYLESGSMCGRLLCHFLSLQFYLSDYIKIHFLKIKERWHLSPRFSSLFTVVYPQGNLTTNKESMFLEKSTYTSNFF